MMRGLRLLLGVSLLLCSWPAAAVERAVEVRAAPPAAVLAPAALGGLSLPELRALGTGVSGGAALSAPAVPALPSAQAPAGATAAGPASISFTPGGPASAPVPIAASRLQAGPRGPNQATDQHAPGPVDHLKAGLPSAADQPGSSAAGEAARGSVDPRAQASAAAESADAAFDGASKRPAAVRALPAAVPAAAFGAAFLPLAAAHAHHAASVLVPALGQGSYLVGNALSAAMPLPDIYRALDRSRPGPPPVRTLLGAAASMALGVVNATVLGQPLWGVIHVFVGLGMIAPLVLRRLPARAGPGRAYVAPQGLTLVSRVSNRLAHDATLRRTLAWGLALGAAAAAIYALSAAAVPALLAAHLSRGAIAAVLLVLQIAKGALFGALFAIDAAALARGRGTNGFSKAFTAIFLASSLAYAAWGFILAGLSPAGTPRDQHLINGLRNLLTALASAASAWFTARRARPR
jgi:hypothetical protein